MAWYEGIQLVRRDTTTSPGGSELPQARLAGRLERGYPVLAQSYA